MATTTNSRRHAGPGTAIRIDGGRMVVPDDPVIPFLAGDGTGPDILGAARIVLDGAVNAAYGGRRRLVWFELPAGERAFRETGEWLPASTVEAIRHYVVALKGPLTTPVGGGIRSLNVTLRQDLDLYACIRPVRYFDGVPSPMKEPGKLDVVIFRENTEDVYAGIEFERGSEAARRIIAFLGDELGKTVRADSGVGIKPISEFGTRRIVRAALRYATDRGRRSVTIVHKGNIMKFTEGAFRTWAYQVAREEFGDRTITEDEVQRDHGGVVPAGKVLVNDRIADAMFQQLLLRPDEYDVIVTPNLNGDYLSDACAAQVGGLGMAPGANIGDFVGVFEATHGTAPKYAGQDKVNPGSVILSGCMMLEHLGWPEAAALIVRGLQETIRRKLVTYDLERQMTGATLLSGSAFARAIVENFR
jgi:isocitrate dehydrogenase